MTVPEEANKYWLKRIAPPLEFGSMHAILFQLSLIPITMCRYTIATISTSNGGCGAGSFVERIIPLNRMLRIHIHLGYTMILIVCLATIFFFTFFGMLCRDGEVDFCNKFKSEIMITGYVILVVMLAIGITSYLRHSISYKVFYFIHHLVFVLFCVTILHTFDIEQRKGKTERSQTFKWFTSTLLYYICDRIVMKLNHTYLTKTKTVAMKNDVASTTSKKKSLYYNSDGSCNNSQQPQQQMVQLLNNSQLQEESASSTSLQGMMSGLPACGTRRSHRRRKMIILKVTRPALFRFKPGQYAFLRILEIDKYSWHPFSIVSEPSDSSTTLEFYIEVIENNKDKKSSWTRKLYDLLGGGEDENDRRNRIRHHSQRQQLSVEIMGPYGTSLAKTEDYSHVLAISAGTGIVPVLSLFKQHVNNMLQLQPDVYLKQLQERERKILSMDLALERRKGSILSLLLSKCCCKHQKKNSSNKYQDLNQKYDSTSYDDDDFLDASNQNNQTRYDKLNSSLRASFRLHDDDQLGETKQKHTKNQLQRKLRNRPENMRHAAFCATRSIYGVVFLTSLPVLGVALLGVTISWNTISIDLYFGMVEILQVMAVTFQFLFALVATCIWHVNGNGILPYIDVVMCIVAAFADWYWFKVYNEYGTLFPRDITTFSILTGYMTLRLWTNVVMPRHNSWQTRLECISASTLDRLDLVWTTRSAEQVANILPTLFEYWNELVLVWGVENALKVCRITIHVTDPDEDACNKLRKFILQNSNTPATRMFHQGAVQFQRADIGQVIEDHSLDMICNRRKSCSLLAFCGSPEFGHEVHCRKISNDMLMAITGNKKHQMDFVSESYGGSKRRVSGQQNSYTKNAEKTDSMTSIEGSD